MRNSRLVCVLQTPSALLLDSTPNVGPNCLLPGPDPTKRIVGLHLVLLTVGVYRFGNPNAQERT